MNSYKYLTKYTFWNLVLTLILCKTSLSGHKVTTNAGRPIRINLTLYLFTWCVLSPLSKKSTICSAAAKPAFRFASAV